MKVLSELEQSKLRSFRIVILDSVFPYGGEIPRLRGPGTFVTYENEKFGIEATTEKWILPPIFKISVDARRLSDLEKVYQTSKKKVIKIENKIYKLLEKSKGQGTLFVKNEQVEPFNNGFRFSCSIAVAKSEWRYKKEI